MDLQNVPMAPSGVGGGMPTRWIYSEYGRMLNVFGIRNGINITFNTASADDIKNKLSQLYSMRDKGLISNLDIQELEERLRLMSNINIYGNGADQSMSGVSELPQDMEPEESVKESVNEGTYIKLSDYDIYCPKCGSEDYIVKYNSDGSSYGYCMSCDKEFKLDNKTKKVVGLKESATEAQLQALEKARELSQTDEAKAKRRKTIAAKQEAKILGIQESVEGEDDLDDILDELEFDTIYVANDDIIIGSVGVEEDEFIEITDVDFDSEELFFTVYTCDGVDREEGIISFTDLDILIDNGDIEDAEEGEDDEITERVHVRHGKVVKFSASKERMRAKLADRRPENGPNKYKLDKSGHIVRKSAEELKRDKKKSKTFGKKMKKYRRKRNKSARKSRKINRGKK